MNEIVTCEEVMALKTEKTSKSTDSLAVAFSFFFSSFILKATKKRKLAINFYPTILAEIKKK